MSLVRAVVKAAAWFLWLAPYQAGRHHALQKMAALQPHNNPMTDNEPCSSPDWSTRGRSSHIS